MTEQTTTKVLLGVSNGTIDVGHTWKSTGLSHTRWETWSSSGECCNKFIMQKYSL